MAINVKTFKEGFLRLLPLILLIYICISEFHTQYYYWKIFSFNLQFIIIYYWILRDPSILGYGFVFLCGLINDVVLSLPLCTSAISYLFVSLVAAYVRNATVRSTLITDWFTFVVAILIGNFITYFLLKKFTKMLSYKNENTVKYTINIPTPGMTYNNMVRMLNRDDRNKLMKDI